MKKLFFLLTLLPFLSFAQVYDFNSDTDGTAPANITEANGTIVVLTHPTEGKSMVAQTISSGNFAIANMDLFPSASNYSIMWKETYTSPRRSGFILRANGSNLASTGLKQGYLFQVNSATNNVRIYRSNPSSFTQLSSVNLSASGTNISRWYKATVNGNALTLDYSTDGVTFINLITTTDNTHTNGATQYSIGFGSGIGGMYVDDITANIITASTNALHITNINPYQIFQRDDAGKADILIEGTYNGSPTHIEAQWGNNTAWTSLTIDANGPGTFSGTLANQSQGQGTLNVRFSNDILVSNSIENVGIGDIFIIAGQSNASGRGLTLNNYSHGSLKASLFGNDDTWKELTDKVDDNSGQVDGVSSDGIAKGSPWPLVATSIMQSQNVPIAFIPTAKGGSKILQWQPSSNHSDASTLYGSMNRRINAVGGNVKAVLFYQGEGDASANTAQAIYEAHLNAFINTVASDFPGLTTMVGQIGQSNNSELDNIRAAQINTIHSNNNSRIGPSTYDINLADEGGDVLHFKSDSDMQEFARRWTLAIEKTYYSGTNGYGPVVDTGNINYNIINNKITVPFTDDTTPVINSQSTVNLNSFNLINNNNSVLLASAVIVGNSIELTPVSSLDTAQPITLTYASYNTGVDAAIYDNENLPAQNFYNLTVKHNIDGLGVIENTYGDELLIYPNPTDGNFSIDLGHNYQTTGITLTDMSGSVIKSKNHTDSQLLNLKLEEPTGVYLLIIKSGSKQAVIRLVKD